MSDYLFMLESHLTPAQRDVVTAVSTLAAETEDAVFLAGGAMRDMMGGFPITDLDFAVQGNALALAKKVVRRTGAAIVETDSVRKSAELLFPSGVTAEIGMARVEHYAKAGAKPHVKPAPIHEDLLRRDFTINSTALSLHPASRGLLLDPTNGLGDLERRELRAYGNYGFYEDPVRMLRLIRFRARFGFSIADRTEQQYRNARDAEMETRIPPRALFRELRSLAGEANCAEVLSNLAKEGLLELFSPALRGSKLNLGAINKLEKAKEKIPYGVNLNLDNLGLFLYFMTAKLTPREKSALAKALSMTKEEVDLWQKLEQRSRKLESTLKSAKLHRSSELYSRLREAQGDEILFLFLNSKQRLVHDRIRNFLQKHIYLAQEVTDREVIAQTGIDPDHPDFPRMKEEMIVARLDGKKFKPPVKAAPPAPPEPPSTKKSGKRAPARQPAAKKRAGRRK